MAIRPSKKVEHVATETEKMRSMKGKVKESEELRHT
jgi:hypothetical protein